MRSIPVVSVVLTGLGLLSEVFAFNAPPGVLTWCGKAYESTNASFNPGGEFNYPQPQSSPLLYVTIAPRYSIFLESDGEASFIVDAVISNVFGQAFNNVTYTNTDGGKRALTPGPFTTLAIDIMVETTNQLLVSQNVAVNSTGNLFSFSLSASGLKPRLKPYAIDLYGTSLDGYQSYSASTEISILPSRSYGSAVKIDNLYGGLYVQNEKNNWAGWYPIYPSGFYADANYLFASPSALPTYQDYGLTTINLVPDDTEFNYAQLNTYWDLMDSINLLNIYDMRYTYTNLTSVAEQVTMFQNRTTLLMYYTGDEPDGAGDPLNSTKLAYNTIKDLDPYHPVSLVLNCKDFYFPQYTAGTDIIFEDAYPVGINATWSKPFDTPCNTTYGDCGCDDCVGELEDVSDRLDLFTKYQADIQGVWPKPLWAVLQAFGGDNYWATVPSEAEFAVMSVLAVNHNAKGLSAWWYPSSGPIQTVSGEIGKVLQSDAVLGFVFGANAVSAMGVKGAPLLDVAVWLLGGSGNGNGSTALVGIANGEYVDSSKEVTVTLPVSVSGIAETAYGPGGWSVGSGGTLTKKGVSGLEVGFLIVDIE